MYRLPAQISGRGRSFWSRYSMSSNAVAIGAPLARAKFAYRSSWLVAGALLIAALVAAPVVSVGSNVFLGGTGDTWSHLASTVLPEYLMTTLWLCLGVGFGTAALGVGAAWLTTMLDFPGRRVFDWALVLPLAVPAYVMAYTYTDLLQFVGPVQTWLREAFGWRRGDYWFPDVRTTGGAIVMFILVLYPYVYLLARTAFLERAGGMLEVSRSLGLGAWASFFRVQRHLQPVDGYFEGLQLRAFRFRPRRSRCRRGARVVGQGR